MTQRSMHNASTVKPPRATKQGSASRRQPDPILAELWAVKSRLNKEADYDIATLVRQTQSAAKQGWLSQALISKAKAHKAA